VYQIEIIAGSAVFTTVFRACIYLALLMADPWKGLPDNNIGR
jgi:hypothetical protein